MLRAIDWDEGTEPELDARFVQSTPPLEKLKTIWKDKGKALDV